MLKFHLFFYIFASGGARRAKMAPSLLNNFQWRGPRRAKMGPRRLQDAQDGPKMAPRWPQESRRWHQDGPSMRVRDQKMKRRIFLNASFHGCMAPRGARARVSLTTRRKRMQPTHLHPASSPWVRARARLLIDVQSCRHVRAREPF